MRFLTLPLVVLLAVSAARAQPTAGPVGVPRGVWRAQITWIPLNIAGHTYLLYANICRPRANDRSGWLSSRTAHRHRPIKGRE
jgi:hypothetical protein